VVTIETEAAEAVQPDDERPPLTVDEAMDTARGILARLCGTQWTYGITAVSLPYPDTYVVVATITDFDGDQHEVTVAVDEGSTQTVRLDGGFAVNY